MEVEGVLELVRGVAAVDAGCTDRDAVAVAVGQAQRLIAWCEWRQVMYTRLLSSLCSFPEKVFADAARTGLRGASRVFDRATVLQAFPGFEVLLANGRVTVDFVDVLGRSWRSLEPALRVRLQADADRLVSAAAVSSFDVFTQVMRDAVRRVEGDGGLSRLERQRGATRLRAGFDPHSGMFKLSGQFDPVTGLALAGRLDNMIATLFSESVPDGCPTDPSAKQDYLRAWALIALTEGRGNGSGRAEMIVVVDVRQADTDGGPVVDVGLPVAVPLRVLADLVGDADVTTIVVRNGVVLHAPGQLDLGRTTRLANAAQRRVLRGLYPSCAVPGCQVRFQYCKIHHVHWWRHGGVTDLHNLLPLCSRHHRNVHDNGWDLTLAIDRTLTIRFPDQTIMTTGPPSRSAA
ncbi:unannotated protein [freshwater metagenome]|uniref:Unannotated protein n=1 Tax=freshwater metagenome TaxID=449393 RepID=A0A6J7DKK4_9ZZZZ|nr:DUF222 domain-containing protein [Actinomycetota bacterium]